MWTVVEGDVTQLLERGMVFPDSVQGAYQEVEVRLRGEVPRTILILLGVEIFFLALGEGLVFEQLEARIDPQDGESVEARMALIANAAGFPDCKWKGLMSGVLTKKFGR